MERVGTRGPWRMLVVATLSFTVVGFARTAPAEELVATTINWNAGKQRGTALFHGTTDGGVLRGRLYAGNDQFVLEGTMDAGGAVSGTVSGSDRRTIGKFAGQLDLTRRLKGQYTLTGGSGGSWSALALRPGSEPPQH